MKLYFVSAQSGIVLMYSCHTSQRVFVRRVFVRRVLVRWVLFRWVFC